MAVSIMSAWCRASLLRLYLLACFLQVCRQTQVFQARQAHNMFLRSKRANTFLLEEILQGNLERECYEERCSYEEAREFFEDTEKTITFWTVYIDGDQCKPNPCLHGGNCTDMVGGFHCSCTAPHYGLVCELGGTKKPKRGGEVLQCPTEGPMACQQLCTASYSSFTCSCMSGFKLQSDKRTCLPEVEFPCGRLPNLLNGSAPQCQPGKCPWQVSLLNSSGVELCGGAVLGRRSVLTAANCLLLDSDLRPSNFYVVVGNHEMTIPVQALHVHNRFHSHHHDNDLVLLELARPLPYGPGLIQLCLPTKDFSENVLMHSGRTGALEETGAERNQDLVYMTLEECRSQLNFSHPLSNKMFCMRRKNGAETGNHNDVEERSSGHSGENHRRSHHRAQSGAQGPQDRHSEPRGHNRTQTSPPGAQGAPNRTEHNSSVSHPSEDSRCGGPLPGAPVATVEQGTAFLTGLMISSSSGCDGGGLVFTKLSRYQSWIKQKLEAAEDHMTPQVKGYPEER